jgi:hypothetical protein
VTAPTPLFRLKRKTASPDDYSFIVLETRLAEEALMKTIDARAAEIAWTLTMRHTQIGPGMQLINTDYQNSEVHKKECFKLLYGLIERGMNKPVSDNLPFIKWLEED